MRNAPPGRVSRQSVKDSAIRSKIALLSCMPMAVEPSLDTLPYTVSSSKLCLTIDPYIWLLMLT